MARRNPYPFDTGSGRVRKVVALLVVIAVLVLVIKDPVGAASAARTGAHIVASVFGGLTTFAKAVTR